MANMRKFAKMAMTYGKMNERRPPDMRYEMRGGMRNEVRMGYGGYDNRYEDGYEREREPHSGMESRRGQRRNSRGRFMRGAEERGDEDNEMNVIGFYTGDEIIPPYSMDAERRSRDEGEWLRGEMHHGRGKTSGSAKFDREMAMEWAKRMRNADGSVGPHWKMEQVRQIIREKNIKHDEAEFFAILNAMYSDYCAVFKKYGVGDKLDFYVDMTKAWLDDEDAVEDKAGAYYECVVEH